MTGDIPGVRKVFLETVAALRSRTLTAADLAARVRLSKTPESYLAIKNTRPEPAYEALLRAGRTRWYPGERVRFYRARGKNNYVWLPEETAETSTSNDWQERNEQDIAVTPEQRGAIAGRRDYDVEHYVRTLVTSYAERLRKAFAPEDFDQLFSPDQPGLFDRPVESIEPVWIRC
jgi:DNA polymerase elongation subunit (family B)